MPDIHNRRACSKKQRLLHNTFSLIWRTALSQSRYGSRQNKDEAILQICLCLHAAIFALSGCANFQVTVPDFDLVRVKDKAIEYQKKTMHAFF